jgi:hypothetical protein
VRAETGRLEAERQARYAKKKQEDILVGKSEVRWRHGVCTGVCFASVPSPGSSPPPHRPRRARVSSLRVRHPPLFLLALPTTAHYAVVGWREWE